MLKSAIVQAAHREAFAKCHRHHGTCARRGRCRRKRLTVANTFLAMAIDTDTFKPRIHTVTGGLSGPAIRPITLRMVYQCARALKIPVIGLGGIITAEDAVEYFLAGASAVQVGTANFHDPTRAAPRA